MDICNCGSVEEAIKAAEKQVIQMTAADCPVWAFQVAAAAYQLAIAQLAAKVGDEGTPSIVEADNYIFKEVLKLDIQKLMTEAENKRKELYGN